MASGLLDQPEELAWGVSTSMFAHPTTNSLNVVGKAIGGFVFAANMFSFVLVVSAACFINMCQLPTPALWIYCSCGPDAGSSCFSQRNMQAQTRGLLPALESGVTTLLCRPTPLLPPAPCCSCLLWWLSVRRGCARRSRPWACSSHVSSKVPEHMQPRNHPAMACHAPPCPTMLCHAMHACRVCQLT